MFMEPVEMSETQKREARREFWGVSTPSLLACSGVLMGIVGLALMMYSNIFYVLLCIGGLMCIDVALILNLGRDLSLKFRRDNFICHIYFFVIMFFLTGSIFLYRIGVLRPRLLLVLILVFLLVSVVNGFFLVKHFFHGLKIRKDYW